MSSYHSYSYLEGTKTGVNDYRGKSVLFTPGPIYPGKNCGLAHKFYDKLLVKDTLGIDSISDRYTGRRHEIRS